MERQPHIYSIKVVVSECNKKEVLTEVIMDWNKIAEYEGIPGKVVSRGVYWRLNELLNGDGRKNSSETYRLKTSVCNVIAASMNLRTLLQLRNDDMPEAQQKAETLISMIEAGRA